MTILNATSCYDVSIIVDCVKPVFSSIGGCKVYIDSKEHAACLKTVIPSKDVVACSSISQMQLMSNNENDIFVVTNAANVSGPFMELSSKVPVIEIGDVA